MKFCATATPIEAAMPTSEPAPMATDAATMVVDQFNGFSAETRAQVAVWLIGNEIAPDDPFTAQTLAVIKAKAQPPLDTLPICVPLQMSSTADGPE